MGAVNNFVTERFNKTGGTLDDIVSVIFYSNKSRIIS